MGGIVENDDVHALRLTRSNISHLRVKEWDMAEQIAATVPRQPLSDGEMGCWSVALVVGNWDLVVGGARRPDALVCFSRSAFGVQRSVFYRGRDGSPSRPEKHFTSSFAKATE
jgi:hypothetical protein